MKKNVLEIKGVHKTFGSNKVLDGLDLSVKEGEIIGLIGSSGVGKTTLLKCINQLEKVDTGAIIFDGVDITKLSEKALNDLRTQIGIVFQNYNLWSHKTVLENVTEPLIQVQKKGKKESEKAAEQVLERIGLIEKINEFPHNLSGGQQQRVAIARALVLNPKILLLDEVTSALDPSLIGEIKDLIKQLAREGQTMIIVGHDIPFIKDISDKIVVLGKGKIVAEGHPQKLLESKKDDLIKKLLG